MATAQVMTTLQVMATFKRLACLSLSIKGGDMGNKKNSDEHRRCQAHSDGERKRYVRDLWIYSGAIIFFMPLGMQIFCLAGLSFLSLSIIDDDDGE